MEVDSVNAEANLWLSGYADVGDSLRLGGSTWITKWVKVGTHFAFVTVDNDTFYAAKDTTGF